MTKKWIADEDVFIVENYSTMDPKEIARRLDRSLDAVRMRASQLKVHRTKHYWSPEEDKMVLACPRKEIAQVAKELDRTEYSCMLRKYTLLKKQTDVKEGRI